MAWWDELVCVICNESIDPAEVEPGEDIPDACARCQAVIYIQRVVRYEEDEKAPF